MNDTQIRLQLDSSLVETIAAAQIAPGQFKLQSTPLMAPGSLYLGDVLALEPLPNGSYAMRGVLARAPFRHHSWVVNRWFAGSDDYSEFVAAVENAGGVVERQAGGLVYAHVPERSHFDAGAALDHHLLRNASRPTVKLRSFWARLWNA